ncbi:unnamed protein product [Mytilus edulis]|uniref:C-type lectin domain-containing protein n=1 Tax=Mytilus edulis TaxID=6550 RepID=A0A8S3QPU4_MYTED|nr:unnamed protein product [Mytilus edulis]
MRLCITLNLMVLLVFAEGFLLQNGTAPGTVFQQNGCPFGWTKYSLHCYYYSVSRKTWTTAESTCEQFGGHLVIIEDNDEDSFIQSFLNVSKTFANDWSSSYTWAGASDLAEEGNWLWVTGKPVGVFTNWRGPGQITDIMVAIPRTKTTMKTAFIGRFIERSLKLSNYDVNDRTFHYTWIGASDLAKEGNWLWVTGKPVGVYTNWRGPGQITEIMAVIPRIVWTGVLEVGMTVTVLVT